MGKEKIYSFSERDNLRQVAMELVAFSKVNFEVKQIKDITYNITRDFMKSKTSTCNQTTLDNYSSRLNKIERLVNQTYKSCNVDWSNIKVQSTIGQDKLRNIPMGIGDFEKLIAYAKDNGLTSKGILGAQLAGAFGLRVSEVCKLQHRDIDLVNMKIHIHESKGGLSRDLFIKEEYKELLEKSLVNKTSLDRLVPIKEDSVNKWIRETLPKVEGIDSSKYIKAKTGIHCIRKMWASQRYKELITSGVNDKDACNKVSVELGHGENRWDVVKNYIYK